MSIAPSAMRIAQTKRFFSATKLLISCFVCVTSPCVVKADISTEVQRLVAQSEANPADQTVVHQAWQQVVDGSTAEDLPTVLGAMEGVGPLTENWLRGAADAIAERQLSQTGQLPVAILESFLLDTTQAPRARRSAYEWLTKVDQTASTRLLPKMLDDSSLELRYDAVAGLMQRAKAEADEQQKTSLYQLALNSARHDSQLKDCAEALTQLGQQPNMARQLGFLTQWKVIGPFDNSEREGFDRVYPPELKIDLSAELEGKSGTVAWKDAEAEQQDFDKLGMVDLNAALGEAKSVLGYAYTTIEVPKDTEAECRYESIEATKLWVNGELLAERNIYHSGSGFDQYVVPCNLRSGVNHILLKVCQNEQTEPWTRRWEFRLRVTDSLGGPIGQSLADGE